MGFFSFQHKAYNTYRGCIQDLILKHTITLLSLSDHYILSREWRVIVHQVQTNYHGRPMVL